MNSAYIIYFLGRTSRKSLARRAFPEWCARGGLNTVLEIIDADPTTSDEVFTSCLTRIRTESRCLGAQITSHKTRLYALKAHLDDVTSEARITREIGGVLKRGGCLIGFSPDVAALRIELPALVRRNPHLGPDFPLMILGGGGAATSIAATAISMGVTRRIAISEVIPSRVDDLKSWARTIAHGAEMTIESPLSMEKRLADERSPALVVNATGLGKDVPGSPLSDSVQLPLHSTLWDLNYRGDLDFLGTLSARLDLMRIDGFEYFCRNWAEFLDAVARPWGFELSYDEIVAVAHSMRERTA